MGPKKEIKRDEEPTDDEWEQAVELEITKRLITNFNTSVIGEIIGGNFYVLNLTPGVIKALRYMNGFDEEMEISYIDHENHIRIDLFHDSMNGRNI